MQVRKIMGAGMHGNIPEAWQRGAVALLACVQACRFCSVRRSTVSIYVK